MTVALPTEPHGIPYHYHAQRIFCAIMFNNVAYQAATDGRAFQLIPLTLFSLVRSSTTRLLVACVTGTNSLLSSQPSSLQVVAAGIHRPRCQSYFVPISQRTFLLSSLRKVRDSNSRYVAVCLVSGEVPSSTRPTFLMFFCLKSYYVTMSFLKTCEPHGGQEMKKKN